MSTEKTDYYLHTFPNGIRWVHKQVKNTKVVHCGIMLDIGSRDEKENELGIAHFWEHMAFKGTKTKKSTYILNRIDNLGGELNAYTTREKICFHASLLDRHFPKAIELLTDITFNSVFPLKEIEKEKKVIIEEMSLYADNPEDAIQDQFDSNIFIGNTLGNNILGSKESVSGFTQQDFNSFLATHIDTSRLVLSTVGGFPASRAARTVEKYLGELPTIHNPLVRTSQHLPSKKIEIVKKPISQAHCMIGRSSYALNDTRRFTFFVLNNILGGPAMNARLNVALREKYGLVYGIDAQYSPYTDTGLWSIYFGTEKRQIKKATDLVLSELKKLRETPLSPKQLKTAKEQLKGQLAISEEHNNGMMQVMARNILDVGHLESLTNIFAKIEAINPADLQQVAQEMFKEDELNYLIFEPEK